jgi:centrosomal protein CEP44
MSVGDLTNSLEKLRRGLRAIRFPIHLLDEAAVGEGHSLQFLSILQYCLQSYSADVAAYLADHNCELTRPPDEAYLETVFKVLRDLFDYRPVLTQSQFLRQGYAERKIWMVLDVMGLVHSLHESLNRTSVPASRATTTTPPKAVLKRSPTRSKTPVKSTLEFCSPTNMFNKALKTPSMSYFQHSPEKHARASITLSKPSKSSSQPLKQSQVTDTLSAVVARLEEFEIRVSTWMSQTDEKLEWLTERLASM